MIFFHNYVTSDVFYKLLYSEFLNHQVRASFFTWVILGVDTDWPLFYCFESTCMRLFFKITVKLSVSCEQCNFFINTRQQQTYQNRFLKLKRTFCFQIFLKNLHRGDPMWNSRANARILKEPPDNWASNLRWGGKVFVDGFQVVVFSRKNDGFGMIESRFLYEYFWKYGGKEVEFWNHGKAGV